MSKEAMVKINVRLPQYVVDYFRQYTNYTGAVRAALIAHVNKQKEPTDADELYIGTNRV